MFKRPKFPKAMLGLSAAIVVAGSVISSGAVSAHNYDHHETTACGSQSWAAHRSSGLNVVGLTDDQRLICFQENDARNAATIGDVRGLSGDTKLVGIDYRPSRNLLYGVGNAGGVYTISTDSAVATKTGQLSIALSGASYGVDVNPAADALRITSETGQNLRFSFATGVTFADKTLTYPPATTAAAGISGSAYTNNDTDATTGTALYDIDSILDQVVTQTPANDGLLMATGKIGPDTTAHVGFDIYSTLTGTAATDNRGFASLTVGGQSRFYGISLMTGSATLLGSFSSYNQVIGIAVPPAQR